ncbi:hypothetical protein [Bacteroides sp.]|uniref:hypothetical protein n=1 Tax=Bacteroides sp. TaxID=29523 RepID=UPI002605F0AB|nr:hypothetical protein [Bacteroides sp.]MDD3039542.1 hypothetical protein [Bacteroides sp.]
MSVIRRIKKIIASTLVVATLIVVMPILAAILLGLATLVVLIAYIFGIYGAIFGDDLEEYDFSCLFGADEDDD